ncbi:hypothetical protein D3C81_650000 [compost metagenome]
MPQVQRERHQSDSDHGSNGQDAAHQGFTEVASSQDQRSAQRRDYRDITREAFGLAHVGERPGEQQRADDSHGLGMPAADACLDGVCQEVGDAANQQLACARWQHVVGERGVGRKLALAIPERRCRDQRRHAHGCRAASEFQRQQEQGRPDHVELLFDAQRPHVQQRHGVGRGGKVAGVEELPEVDVGRRQRGRDSGERQGLGIFREHEQRAEHQGRQCREQGGGEDASNPAHVEVSERERARCCLSGDDAGDQEAGDHKEDVDAYEPAG